MSADNANKNFKAMPIKKEPLTLNGSAEPNLRLSSFSMPRDLTLGGAGRGGRGGSANKKVFTPNLNVTRNKNANVKTSKDTSSRGRTRPDRGKSERGRGRGAARGNANFVQTSGVFSEGAGALNSRRHMSSSSFSRTESETPSSMRRPTLVKREGGSKIDIKAEAEHIRELLGDSGDDDFGDQKADPDWVPIKISDAKWKEFKVEKKEEPIDVAIKIETDAEEKSDKTDALMHKIQALQVGRKQGATNMSRYPISVDELLTSAQPQLFLMQLPDTLPCEDPDDSPENPSSTSKDQTLEPEPVEKKNPLKEMAEGQIGKLIRYKSGKLKLVLGESHFDVTMGIDTGFLQDIMSISTNREERSGNMINLGPIQAKLTATPDWEYLLMQK